MRSIFRVFCLACLCWCVTNTYAQKKDSTWVGTIEGTIRDSVYNFDLQSATLTLYKASDSSLVTYSLADGFGAFHFSELPLGTLLRLTASYVGYKNQDVFIRISKDTRKFTVPTINMERSGDSLNEVIVKSTAPIQMNGDTLEFNADAFHLDKNAVVEDLLRKIPNVTVWGDGSITVNGKEIKSLKVDGKPFMGGDSKLALQNISKGAVDKIQVYQVSKNESNMMDSTAEINIKLKADKKTSSFGKIGAGIGTDGRYTADGNYTIINGKTQIGIAVSTNNVNETPESVEAQLRNGTFKGVNASPEYQPDFSKAGVNKFTAGGIMLQHDYVENPTWNNTERLSANYFISNNNQTNTTRTNTQSLLGQDSSQTNLSNSTGHSTTLNNQLNGNYVKQKPQKTINVSLNGNITKNTNDNQQESQVYNQTNTLVSTNIVSSNSETNSKNMGLNISFEHGQAGWYSDYSKRFPSNYNLNYSMSAGNSSSNQIQKTDFTSLLDPSQNRLIDRHYDQNGNQMSHNLTGSWGDFVPWIFGRRSFLKNTTLKINNNLTINTNRQNSRVSDWDTSLHIFQENNYLTNDNRYTTVDEQPGLELTKSIMKYSANRYYKYLSIGLSPKWRFFNQKNTATQLFQNFSRSYARFIPSVNINYYNNQMGAYNENLGLSYSIQSDMPDLNQLYPLVDSANITYLSLGNPNLRPTKRQEISVNFSHWDEHNGKNTFNFYLNASIGKVDNFFADSSYTDELGRTRHFAVNADGNRYFSFNGNFNKAVKIKKNHQLQFQFTTYARLDRTPNYVNEVSNVSNGFTANNTFNVYYTYKGIWATNIKQTYNYYRSKQTGINNTIYSNVDMTTSFSSSVNPISRWTIGSNVNFNRRTFSSTAANTFTIWNAYTAYRLLKGNNLEFKFSAMDLLHQNRNVFNSGSNNTVTQTWTNTLQQYFMFSISYFPRKFGKTEKKEKETEEITY